VSFLDAEDALIERYQQRVSARIYSSDELAQIEEKAQVAPSVHVIYDGWAPTNEVGQGSVQEIEHRWLAVVCVRSSSQRNQSAGKRQKASEIIDEVIRASIGWRPGQGYKPLRFADSPKPAYSDAGFAYFPLAFATRTQHRAY